MNILVVGGAGYIGSHVCRKLESAGHRVIVYDNLSSGHRESVPEFEFINACIGDSDILQRIFREYNIGAVMHFAAHIEVGESVSNPSKYYLNNFSRVINLLDRMVENGVSNFIFSSTAAVYGDLQKEESLNEALPCRPVNPYGKSKLMVENTLSDYAEAYGLRYTIFRYFNAAGADDAGDIGESHEPETHLIPLVLKAASGERELINIFGTDYNTPDGTCIRDFIHVNDIAEGHIKGLERMIKEDVSDIFNLGSGTGFSVKEIIETSEEVTGRKIVSIETGRRDGDPAILIADSKKAQEKLSWEPVYSLKRIIETAWNWEINRRY